MATVISKQTIQALVFDSGIDVSTVAVNLPDASYALPSESWIADQFASAFFGFRNREIGSYAPGVADCDDFVRAASWYAWKCFRATPDLPKDTGFAFGEFYFEKENVGPHAVNVAVVRESEKLRLVFFEPQTCSIITLTKKAIASCNYFGM